MATVKGVNYTKQEDPSSANIIGKGQWPGEVLVQVDSYEAASLASGSVIKVAKLPAGAKVLKVEVSHDALGSGVTLAVGNGGSGQSAIFSAAASAASASANPRQCQLADGSAYVVGTLSGDDDVTLTTGGATATGTIKTVTYYTK